MATRRSRKRPGAPGPGEGETRARAAAYEAKTETRRPTDFMLHDLGPKLDGVEQTRLLQSVADKAAACYQAQSHDFAHTPEQAR